MIKLSNDEIADVLNQIADVLEEHEENPYRIRAYRKAARSVKRFAKNIVELFDNNEDLTIIPNVGKHIAERIQNILLNNEKVFPTFKSAQAYPKKLLNKPRKPVFFRIYSLIKIIERVVKQLEHLPTTEEVSSSSAFRRKNEIVSDIDIIIVTADIQATFDAFHSFAAIKYIIENGDNYTTVQLKLGIQVTLYAVDKNSFGAKLLHATGGKNHYEILQQLAKTKGFRLDESGLFDKSNQLIAGKTEEEIYHQLDMQYVPPELRENRGEIAAATTHSLPKLIELADIKGDLHCHTNETDGVYSLEEMVEAAMQQGYEYVAITDHSQSLRITHGMNEKRLLKQMEKIDQLNAKLSHFKILKSMEVDILEDGSLDLSDDVLKQLDLTVCSVHSKFRLSLEKQTERVIRAMDNPYFNILGHATGRLIHHRPPYEIDIDRIFQAAVDRGHFIEVNSQPARLDINDIYCKKAKELGLKMSISSDAHTTRGFSFMILGVNQARRGWLEAKDVINTYKLEQLIKLLRRN